MDIILLKSLGASVAFLLAVRLMNFIAVIGGTLFLATTGSVATSALWFFLTWIQEGTAPSY